MEQKLKNYVKLAKGIVKDNPSIVVGAVLVVGALIWLL